MLARLLFAIALSGVCCGSAMAQQTHSATPVFAVAEIQESPRVRIPFSDGGHMNGDRYYLRQSTLVDMIAAAYGIKPEMVQGGPAWLEMNRFDLVAKTAANTSPADLKLMLQSLLADRFKLVLHKGKAPMPAYLLIAPGGKSKLKPTEEGEAKTCKGDNTPQTAGGAPLSGISCAGMSADELAILLNEVAASYLTEPVLNQTGLEGAYDFTLRWTDFRQRAKAGAEAVSIFDAVEKDLGLKLELKTAPRPVWIVDSVNQKPAPNSPGVAKELPPPPPAHFEVSTIKPSRPDERPGGRISNGQMNVTGMTLRDLIVFAWDLSPNDPQMIAGAPKWLNETRFDIVAKSSDSVRLDSKEFGQMLRDLLIERFNMRIRMEERPIEAYSLVADHPKLKEADPKSRTRCKEGLGPDGKDPRKTNPMLTVLWTCQNMTMAQLGEELAHFSTGYVYTPVLDATGLKGGYDFTLTWSSASLTILKPLPPPGQPQAGSDSATDPNGAITLYDAIDKQLGIKMVKSRRPVPILVIDHIDDTPTEN